MFNLSICFGNTVWMLRFKTEEKANAAYEAFKAPAGTVEVVDDFDQRVCMPSGALHGVMLEDMEKSGEAHIHQMLHNAQLQATAQQRAQTQGVGRRNGPPIIDPTRLAFPFPMSNVGR